jgi:cytoskeletal protein CcmA (bactofilin family)
MGLKENFNQAMKELLNKGGLVGSEMEEKAKAKSDLDSYLNVPQSYSSETGSAGRSGSVPFDQEKATIATGVSDTDWKSPPFEDYSSFKTTNTYAPSPSQDGEYGRMFRQAEEMTIISKNTMIIGDVKTLANITIEGNVRGKVDAMKDANIRGMLIGDLTCNNSDIRGSSIQGNVYTKGSTFIDNDSILLGDITAQFASVDGKVKGNLDVGSKVELRHNAIVAGNINTNTISIEDGANIRGYINTTFLRENGDNAFPKQVVINNDISE